MKKILLGITCLFSLLFITSCVNKREAYTITFDTNGGSTVEAQEVYHDQKVTRPEVAPTKEGHTFIDWFGDEALTTVYDFNSRVRKEFTIYAKWSVNSYKLNYVTNVEGYEIKSQNVKYNTEIDVPEVDEEKFIITGSTFNGWYTDAEFTKEFTKSKMPANDVTLYAQWIKNDHKVSIFVDDIEKDPVTVKYGDKFADFKDKIAAPTKDGFGFAGWFLNKTDANPIADDYVITKDIELHAKWNAKIFTLTFDSNGGSAVQSTTYAFNSTITAPTAPTKTGYTFAGWYLGENRFDFTAQKMPASNITLVAKWNANSYTVQYFANTGEGTLNDSKLTIEGELTLPTNTFTKVGYTFTGWNTKADGTGTTYADGAKISLNATNPENIKLYAQWTANTYTIKFDANMNGVTAPTNVNATYDVNATLPQALALTGYKFLGWNTKADGTGTNYVAGQNVKNLSTNEDVTLYAKWEHVEYTLTINIQTKLTEIKLHYNDNIPVQPDPEISGYDFDGWFAFINNEWVPFSFENAKMPNSNLTIAAKFLGEVTITFISDGQVHKTLTGFEGDTLTETVTEPSRDGYTFDGWYTENTFENKYTLPNIYPTSSYNVYAKWTINQYTVTFIYGNGKPNDEVTLDFGSKLTEPNEPNKEGHTFAGWYYGTTPVVFDTFTVPASDIEIEVKWTVNPYTIEFDVNNGDNPVSPITQNYNTTVTKPADPEREGYTFNGWFLEGSNTPYVFSTMPSSNITLVAQWKANPYDLKINIKGKEEVVTTIYHDQNISDVLTYSLEEGKSFNGWYSDQNLTTRFNTDGKVSGDITVYAEYTINTYKVNFISEGKVIYSPTKEYGTAVSFNTYAKNIISYGTAYSTLKQTILGVIGNVVTTEQLYSTINAGYSIYETNENLKYYCDVIKNNTIGDVDAEAYFQQFYSYVSSLSDTTNSLLLTFEKIENNYFPTRYGYVFGGWVLGADTVYNGKTTGEPFLGVTPASTINDGKEVNIVAKWDKLVGVEDLAEDKDEKNTIIWTPIDKDNIKLDEGETSVVTYKIYHKNDNEELQYLDSIQHNNDEKMSYTFMTHDTFKSPGDYNLVIITLVEIYKNENLVRSYETQESNTLEKTLKVNPGNVTIGSSGDNYHKDGDTFYFFTNLDYKFINSDSYTYDLELTEGDSSLVSIENNLTEDGKTYSKITTTSKTGTFKFTNNGVKYNAIVFPYVSQFTLGSDLQNIKESNAETSMFRGKNAQYTIGRAYEDIGSKLNKHAKLYTGYYTDTTTSFYNGFRFDLNVLTTGGKAINILETGYQYLSYTFYKDNGNLKYKEDGTINSGDIIDHDSMGIYNEDMDAWSFTAEKGNYVVEIAINPLYVSNKLVVDGIIKPVVFKFTLDDSINVYTHEQFKAIFADQNLKGGISLHNNIEARLDANQLYGDPSNPFYDLADNAEKAIGTPISTKNDDIYNLRENPYGSVYSRIKTELNETYVINGNCFQIDGSTLPYVSIHAEEDLSVVTGYHIASVHVALIHYISTDSIDTEASNSNLYINDLKLVGNTKKYNSEADGSTIEAMNRNSGGYLGVMVSYGCGLFVDNSIVLNTTVAINNNNKASLTLTNSVIKNSFSNSIYAYDNGDITITNSLLEDAGGAAIHVEDTETYLEYGTTNVTKCGAKIEISTDTVINNYVSGDEGFFKARSFEVLITGMKAQFQEGALENGMTMIETVTENGLPTEKVNLIMLLVPRGDNSDKQRFDINVENGNRTNNDNSGKYIGMGYNMMDLSFKQSKSIVENVVRTQVEKQVRQQAAAGGITDEATIQTLIANQMASEEIQATINATYSGLVSATPASINTKELESAGGVAVIPVIPDQTKKNNLGSGYMLKSYDVPTFGNSIIVMGVKGLPKNSN